MNKTFSPKDKASASRAPAPVVEAGGLRHGRPAEAQRICIMVLGMHRSGTSALTRVISLLGAELPKEMLGANPTNPTGHWEPQRLIDLHDRMLAEAGSRWDDWRPFDLADLARPRAQFYRAEIARIIEEEFGTASLFVLKEPRMGRFVPLYAGIFEAMGIEVRYVHTCRNPLAVIGSLEKRDRFTAGFTSLLWLRHELEAEHATRHARRVFVSYEDFLRDWRKVLAQIDDALEITWSRTAEEAAPEIDAYLSTDHQHHVASEARLKADGRVGRWVKDGYAALRALGSNADDSQAQLVLERIKAEFDGVSPVFGDAFYDELSRRQSQLADAERHWRETAEHRENELARVAAETSAQAANAASLIEQARQEQEELQRLLAEKEAGLTQVSTELEQVRVEAGQREAELAGALEGQSRLSVERAEETARIADEAAAREVELSKDLARQRALTGKRDAEIARLTADWAARETQFSGDLEGQQRLAIERAEENARLAAAAARREAELLQQVGHHRRLLDEQAENIARISAEKETREAELSTIAEQNARLVEEKVQSIAEARETEAASAHELEAIRLLAEEREAEVAKLAAQSQSADEKLSRLSQRAAELSGLLDQREIELGQQRALIDEAEQTRLQNASVSAAHTDYLVSEIHRHLETISAMASSSSWRLTRGMRLIKRLLTQPRYVAAWGAGKLLPAARRLPLKAGTKAGLKASAIRMGLLSNAAPIGGDGSFSPDPGLVPHAAGAISHRNSTVAPLLAYARQVLASSQKPAGLNLEYVGKAAEPFDTSRSPLQLVAFYLPQFHPIPENDAWWGKGFTEWTNVSKAVPQFVGHYQPHLPGELGFYDLRLDEVMQQQAELAKFYGLGGFCFHYYWFGGKRILEGPVERYLSNEKVNFPFCFCWANENWTRRWDGQDNEILIAQHHSPEDDIAFIEDVARAFRDPRYIRFQGKPVLLVYRISLLPDAGHTAERWRRRCRELGIGEIYLVASRSFEVTDPRPYGFDAAVEFPPHQIPAARINDQVAVVNPGYRGNIYSYADLAAGYATQRVSDYPLIKTVAPSWDNEARKPGAGHTFFGANPSSYARWLRQVYAATADIVKANAEQPPFVFINAWNEWAEGAHLEPDRRYGYAYLHATANIARDHFVLPDEVKSLISRSRTESRKTADTAIVVHLYHADLYDEMVSRIANVGDFDIFFSLRPDVSAATCRRILYDFPNASLYIFPNVGRDFQPFLTILRDISDRNYTLLCKVHSKKSPQRTDGDKLRSSALNSMLGSAVSVDKIRSDFALDPSLGIFAPRGALIDLALRDRNILNRQWLDQLLPRIGRSDLVGRYNCEFVAGSMFWARVDALSPLLELSLQTTDFEEEVGQFDGTLAHALERIVVAAAAARGYKTRECSSTGGLTGNL